MLYRYRNLAYLIIFYLDEERNIRFRKDECAQR